MSDAPAKPLPVKYQHVSRRRYLCYTCPTPCNPRPDPVLPESKCPLAEPRWPAVSQFGLGDLVEVASKPIAKALRLPCLNPDGTLKPDSGCAKRKEILNHLIPNLNPLK